MFLSILFLVGSVMIARMIAGYDSRCCARRHFTVKNGLLCTALLPKYVFFKNELYRTQQEDSCKMTYTGAFTYVICVIVWLSIPILLFVLPEAKILQADITGFTPIRADTGIVHYLIRTLLVFELVVFFLSSIFDAKKKTPDAKSYIYVFFAAVVSFAGIGAMYFGFRDIIAILQCI